MMTLPRLWNSLWTALKSVQTQNFIITTWWNLLLYGWPRWQTDIMKRPLSPTRKMLLRRRFPKRFPSCARWTACLLLILIIRLPAGWILPAEAPAMHLLQTGMRPMPSDLLPLGADGRRIMPPVSGPVLSVIIIFQEWKYIFLRKGRALINGRKNG